MNPVPEKLSVTFERCGIDVSVTLTTEESENCAEALNFGLRLAVLDDRGDMVGVLVPTDEYLELRRAAGRYTP